MQKNANKVIKTSNEVIKTSDNINLEENNDTTPVVSPSITYAAPPKNMEEESLAEELAEQQEELAEQQDNQSWYQKISFDTKTVVIITFIPFILYLIIYYYELIKNRNLDNLKLSQMLYMIGALLAMFKVMSNFTYDESSQSAHLFLIGLIFLNIKNATILIGY